MQIGNFKHTINVVLHGVHMISQKIRSSSRGQTGRPSRLSNPSLTLLETETKLLEKTNVIEIALSINRRRTQNRKLRLNLSFQTIVKKKLGKKNHMVDHWNSEEDASQNITEDEQFKVESVLVQDVSKDVMVLDG